jgi:hypothetical protein
LEIYRNTIDNILCYKEPIPEEWKMGNIITIYKGKGKKGQMKNERGITLSSNLGKFAERLIANRIKKQIKITDNQAGGMCNRATTDHIITMKNIIYNNKKMRKPTYICYLDVTKAYDKAWLEAVMYTLGKSGTKPEEWKLTKEMSNNLKATIQTKHGNTRTININDSIRQGGVLSVIQYANLMDEIAKEINEKKLGNGQKDNGKKIACLLWMDDVALISDNEKELQDMLNITDEIAKKYRIKFGNEKSKIISIGTKKVTNCSLGDMKLEHTENYKYLGYIMNTKNNNKDHINAIKSKAEMAYQTSLSIMGNKDFRGMEMAVAWKLIKSTVIPILTYAGEALQLNKTETTEINRKLDDILKRVLMIPQSTPREPIYLETGMLDIETIINRNKLLLYNRITRNPNEMTSENLDTNNPTEWCSNIQELFVRYEITNTQLENCTKNQAKKLINQKVREKFRRELISKGIEKSKVKHYLLNTNLRKPNSKLDNTYIYKLTRKEVSTIIMARTRMLNTKTNYKAKFDNTLCRNCGKSEETQKHILEECEKTTKDQTLTITCKDLRMQTPTMLRLTAKRIQKIMENHLKEE